MKKSIFVSLLINNIIHCNNEDEAREFLSYAKYLDLRWISGLKVTVNNRDRKVFWNTTHPAYKIKITSNFRIRLVRVSYIEIMEERVIEYKKFKQLVTEHVLSQKMRFTS